MKPQDMPCYDVLLAPFQQATRIELETNINTSTECCLNIKNTCDKLLHVTVTKAPAPERHITLTSSELDIEGNDIGVIYIKWTPREAGCWRDVLQLTDNKRVKYNIHIATTAKSFKKSNKPQKKAAKPLSSGFSNHAASISNKRVQQNNEIQIPVLNQPRLITHFEAKQSRSKYEIGSNKENICSANGETKLGALQGRNDGVNRHSVKMENVLYEQNANVWNDGSILPQVLLPSNELQDSRRVTYVKERRHYGGVLYEHNEEEEEEEEEEKKEVPKDTTSDKPQSDFSMLLDKFTLASVNEARPSSPRSSKQESMEESSSQSGDKHRTFNISPGKSFVVSALSPSCNKTIAKTTHNNVLSQSVGVYNLSPIKFDGCSLANGPTDIISSSPITHFACDGSRDFREQSRRFAIDTIDRGVQTTPKDYFVFEIIPEKRKSGDMYIEISPPKKSHLLSKTVSASVTKLSNPGRVFKNKPVYDGRRKHKELRLNSTPGRKNTPAIKLTKLSLNALSQTKWHSSSFRESTRIERKDESFIYEKFELDLFALSTTEDPFLKKFGYCDEKWMLRQELAFTKWLNALLSSPEDLSVDIETAVIDIGKIWQSCKAQKDNLLAETREAVSARYHTSTRLNTLRKAASAMYTRDEIAKIFSSTSEYIAKGTLSIRSDRNLQRDIGLQKLILSLFLSYNPLWLRIGLETVYGECIPLRSNNDIIGLTRFLLNRFFSDPRITKMSGYHKTNPSQKLVTTMNQFILKKFLFLVYFLDYAKQRKLIGHDPCLFHKRSEYKESREILLSFSREVLSGIGDVTKMLRSHNYVLTYRQTYIEEYDYAVTNIRYDLRDGVRLCRAMELITGRRGLTERCRVPAISRLQKIHNVDVALNALRDAGYVLEGDIDAKSIADGHCEKTLSLLWQIIHKYQAPRFDRSARVIQKWWRAQLWYICVKKFLRARRNLAALVIQRAWRRKLTPPWWREVDFNLEERKRFLRARTAAIQLQRWWRNWRRTRVFREKLQEARKRRRAVTAIQRRWRASLLMKVKRNEFLRLKNAALTVQAHWKATRAMKLQRSEYLACKNAATRIQSWWRSEKIAREQRERFLRIGKSARVIQSWWRRYLLMREARNNFLRVKFAVRTIEIWWTSVLERKKFLRYRESVVVIQRRWRTHRARRRETASVKIQTWWREVILTRRQREEFLRLRNATLAVQKNWRARTARRRYLEQRRAASLIQSWYRRAKLARAVRQRYLEMRNAAIKIQNFWRGVVLARADRQRYLRQKKACVTLQSWWRMIRQKSEYNKVRTSVLIVQRRWRAIRAARAANRELMRTRAAVVFQAHWKGLLQRRRYVVLRQAAIVVQSRYRMIIAVRRYKTVKHAALTIQIYWRAYVARKRDRSRYLFLRQMVIKIQRRYRRKRAEKEEKLRRQQREESLAMKIRDECKEALHVLQEDTASIARPDSAYWQQVISAIQTCSDLGLLNFYLNNLDTITKLSPTVRIILCEVNVADDIYNMILLNNRSLPWMNVCQQACSILITLAKDPDTRKYVVKEEHALTLVKLLNISLKHKDVFLYCATLIWLLSQDENYAKTLATCPQISWLIQNTQQKLPKSVTTKLQKSKSVENKLDNTTNSALVFTDINCAIEAITKNICDANL
ncbi:protein abnormal spindle isoform X2 [Pseudomyrmex gracilis]|nr:protein abnormal spindle isoform X2 [Pseudomyrmex gracilis]XP_020277493.1 protein abnormal spindle isoform X2 [Pseudomyrmex gracilis]